MKNERDYATKDEFKRAFTLAGYGEEKTKKWLRIWLEKELVDMVMMDGKEVYVFADVYDYTLVTYDGVKQSRLETISG